MLWWRDFRGGGEDLNFGGIVPGKFDKGSSHSKLARRKSNANQALLSRGVISWQKKAIPGVDYKQGLKEILSTVMGKWAKRSFCKSKLQSVQYKSIGLQGMAVSKQRFGQTRIGGNFWLCIWFGEPDFVDLLFKRYFLWFFRYRTCILVLVRRTTFSVSVHSLSAYLWIW